MHYSGTQRRRHGGKFREAPRKPVYERSAFDSRARMHYESRRLVYYDQIFIFINYIERDRLRDEFGNKRSGKFRFNGISFAHAIGGFRRAIVYKHVAFGYLPMKARSAVIGKQRGEILIESFARIRSGYGERDYILRR